MLPVIARHPGFFLSLFKVAARDLAYMLVGRRGFERSVRRGDIVVSLGAGWGFPRYMKRIAAAKARYGIRFATMVYDLIPIENESFVEQRHVVQFRNWLQDALPVADVVLTISRYSRGALIKWAAQPGFSLPRVGVVELGSALAAPPPQQSPEE